MGHFKSIGSCEEWGVEEETFPECGGEAADRRGDVEAGRVGGEGGADVSRSECEPDICVAATVSAGVAGEGARNGELAAGAGEQSAVKQSVSRGPSASCPRTGGSGGCDFTWNLRRTSSYHGPCGCGSIACGAGAVAVIGYERARNAAMIYGDKGETS